MSFLMDISLGKDHLDPGGHVWLIVSIGFGR